MTLQLVLRPTIINPARVQLYYAKAVLSMPLYYAMQYMWLCYFWFSLRFNGVSLFDWYLCQNDEYVRCNTELSRSYR